MNFGIVGAGKIAEQMAKTINEMPSEACIYAIASRTMDKAKSFAKKYNVEKTYDSYEKMLSDDNIDIVYVATPHAFHFEQSLAALKRGKHVLCEKAFCINAKQSEILIDYAKENGLFLGEAMWTRFLPATIKWKEIIDSGIIGKPVLLDSKFGVSVMNKDRMVEPKLAGGALLDLGIYPLTLSSVLWGDDIEAVLTEAVMTEQGVDRDNYTILSYKNGGKSILSSSINTVMDNNAVVYGTDGYIIAHGASKWDEFTVYDKSQNPIKTYKFECITGYEYEVMAAMKAVKEGKTEFEGMPHSQTLIMMELMDSLRKKWGMVYPMEK